MKRNYDVSIRPFDPYRTEISPQPHGQNIHRLTDRDNGDSAHEGKKTSALRRLCVGLPLKNAQSEILCVHFFNFFFGLCN